jgi:hypothetical protein
MSLVLLPRFENQVAQNLLSGMHLQGLTLEVDRS